MGSVTLRKGRDKSLRRRHPWVFEGAIARVDGSVGPGETVDVFSAGGEWLASGAYSPGSQIRVRAWSFQEGEKICAEFIQARLRRAIEARTSLLSACNTTACRLVFSESDGIPGVIVDRYGEFAVCQFLSAGAEYWRDTVVEFLAGSSSVAGVFERSSDDARLKEGLQPREGPLSGKEPPDVIEISEGPARFLVDVRWGQKTGFYLDQRDSRAQVAGLAADTGVLNCFSYTGAFGIRALKEGASHVTNIDVSGEALALAARNAELNGLDPGLVENVDGDVFEVLRKYRDTRRSFDLVILDPPRFAASAGSVPGGARGYKDINLLGIKLVKPGGVLFTFSCSSHVQPALFQKIVADAAVDAGREAQIVRFLRQAADHPVALNFPEAAYLKGLICRVW